MPDEDTLDTSFELPQDTVVEVRLAEIDPEENVETTEQPALAPAPAPL